MHIDGNEVQREKLFNNYGHRALLKLSFKNEFVNVLFFANHLASRFRVQGTCRVYMFHLFMP